MNSRHWLSSAVEMVLNAMGTQLCYAVTAIGRVKEISLVVQKSSDMRGG